MTDARAFNESVEVLSTSTPDAQIFNQSAEVLLSGNPDAQVFNQSVEVLVAAPLPAVPSLIAMRSQAVQRSAVM